MKGSAINVTDQQQVCAWHFKLVQQNILWATALYFCARRHNYHTINPGYVFTEVKAKKAICKDVPTLPEWLISDKILDFSSCQLLPLEIAICGSAMEGDINIFLIPLSYYVVAWKQDPGSENAQIS